MTTKDSIFEAVSNEWVGGKLFIRVYIGGATAMECSKSGFLARTEENCV